MTDLTDVTLAYEDASPKLLGVISVADIDAEEGPVNRLVEILKLKFCREFESEF